VLHAVPIRCHAVPLRAIDRQAAKNCGATMAARATAHLYFTEEFRMTRRLLAVLAASLLAAAPAALSAQSMSVSLAGGLSLPTGDLGDGVESGYNGTLGLNFGAPLIPVGARLEGSINGFNAKGSGSGDLRVLSATANATFGLGMPYVIGGIGYYNARVKATVGTVTAEQTESGAGFNIGAGLSFPLPALSPFVEIRYHQMTGDNSDIKFIPITFGIKF
jgi:hypothetical protein